MAQSEAPLETRAWCSSVMGSPDMSVEEDLRYWQSAAYEQLDMDETMHRGTSIPNYGSLFSPGSLSRSIPKVTPKSSPNYPGLTPKLSQREPKVIPK